LPIEGDSEFIDLSLKLAYGADFHGYKNKTISAIQTLSGCGGVRMGLELAKKQLPKDITVCVPNPSWPIHSQIVQELNMNLSLFKYFDPKSNGLDFQGLLKDLENVPDKSLVMLHVCSHNPTGVDPS
jgi:aspartate/tyrosine/aromatic aminotransferase